MEALQALAEIIAQQRDEIKHLRKEFEEQKKSSTYWYEKFTQLQESLCKSPEPIVKSENHE